MPCTGLTGIHTVGYSEITKKKELYSERCPTNNNKTAISFQQTTQVFNNSSQRN